MTSRLRRRACGASAAALALLLLAPATAGAAAAEPAGPGSTGPALAATSDARLPTDASLAAVSCPSKGPCYAVGSQDGAVDQGGRFLVVAISGTAVTQVKVPGPKFIEAQLDGISCPTSTFCVAVGQTTDEYGAEQHPAALVMRSGVWRQVGTAGLAAGASLSGVDCRSSTDCVAVGTRSYSSRTLAERFDGTHWTTIRTANPGSGLNVLVGVSCHTSSFCMAVGDVGDYVEGTLAERYDGHRFVAVRTPDPSSGGNALTGVSCTTTRSCVAVGTAPGDGGQGATLAEVWNGREFSVSRSTSPIIGHPHYRIDVLEGVSCPAVRQCAAVGVSGYETSLGETLSSRTWRNLIPGRQPRASWLIGVSCARRGACDAVGFSSPDAGSAQRPLVDRLSGRHWSVLAR